ncbi:hypothetical protein ACOMHN_034630 [Nucella lapillus]
MTTQQTTERCGRMMVGMMVVVMVVVMAMAVGSASGQQVKFLDKEFHVKEGEQLSPRILYIGTITEEVRVIVEVVGDTGDDFIGDTQVATFTPSSTQASVTFTVRDDDEPENKEQFTLKIIFISQGLSLAEPVSATVWVEASDDAFGVFSFLGPSPMVVKETQYTSAVSLRIQRTVSFYETVQITYQVKSLSGEAGNIPSDISPITGQVMFAPAEKEAILQLNIMDDGDLFVCLLRNCLPATEHHG